MRNVRCCRADKEKYLRRAFKILFTNSHRPVSRGVCGRNEIWDHYVESRMASLPPLQSPSSMQPRIPIDRKYLLVDQREEQLPSPEYAMPSSTEFSHAPGFHPMLFAQEDPQLLRGSRRSLLLWTPEVLAVLLGCICLMS